MNKRIRMWLLRVWRWYRRRALFIIADPNDNSVTLSHALFDHMDVLSQEEAKVYVFRLNNGGEYAFTLNPKLEQPSQLADIQYNSKYRTVGFETLCPTVNRIFYDYRIHGDKPVKLSIEPGLTYRTDNKDIAIPILYYKILHP